MTPQPNVGEWYRIGRGDLFEVVAFDADDGTIEIQYFDGTIEELDVDDWEAHTDEGTLEAVEAPEDWTGSVDIEPEDGGRAPDDSDGERRLGARARDGFDRLD